MKSLFSIALIWITVTFSTAVTAATADEAKALVDEGIAYLNEHGWDATLDAISDPEGDFVRGELYLFIIDHEGVAKAHGAKKALIGKSLINLKNMDGVYFIQEMVNLSKANQTGWVEYQWQNPATQKLGAKSTYVAPLNDHDALIACGYYK